MELLQKIKEKWQKRLKEMAEANERAWKRRKPGSCGKEAKGNSKDERR